MLLSSSCCCSLAVMAGERMQWVLPRPDEPSGAGWSLLFAFGRSRRIVLPSSAVGLREGERLSGRRGLGFRRERAARW